MLEVGMVRLQILGVGNVISWRSFGWTFVELIRGRGGRDVPFGDAEVMSCGVMLSPRRS